MTKTIDFLEAVKARSGVASDYAVAKVLGVTHQTVSKYRIGKDFLGDSTAITVAKLLNIEPGYVMASCHAERAKTPDEKAAWMAVLQRFSVNDEYFKTPNCGADALRQAAA